jgi:hypothetical protein
MKPETAKRDGPEKLIARTAGAVGALGLIVGTTITVISYTVLHTTPGLFKAISVSLNLVMLIIYCFFSTKVPRLELKAGTEVGSDYCELLKVQPTSETPDAPGMAARKANRVNRLVVQLHNNIIGYAVALIVVYLLYLFDNKWLFDSYLFKQKYYHQYISAGIKVVIGVFNYLSAVFLYLGFIVLYDKTIEPDDVTPIRYQRKAWILSAVFLLGYLIFSVTFVADLIGADPGRSIQNIKTSITSYEGNTNTSAQEKYNKIKAISSASPNDNLSAQDLMDKIDDVNSSYKDAIKASASGSIKEIEEKIAAHKSTPGQIIFNLLYLFIGICNGLAMTLLFGRYVSMEHSVFSMEEGEYKARKYSKLLHFFTIYVLPLYALAQPLFGSFEIDAFGPRETFANGVFFVCWIGKIGFLYLTYKFMKERLMHLYLHTGVNYRGLPQKLFDCFKFDS